jgi:hypothetical protein
MNKKDLIVKELSGEDKEEIEKDMLESFGFVWITDIGQHADGSLLIVEGLEEEYKDWELWVDWKKKRILLYNEESDLEMIEGGLTNEEDSLFYDR